MFGGGAPFASTTVAVTIRLRPDIVILWSALTVVWNSDSPLGARVIVPGAATTNPSAETWI